MQGNGAVKRPVRAVVVLFQAAVVLMVAAFAGLCVLLAHTASAVLVALVRGTSIADPDPADPWAIAVTATACAVVGVAGAASWAAARRRRRQVAQWAEAHGWDTDVARSVLVGRWSSPPFRRLRGRARDAVRRGPVVSFTYGAGTRARHVVMVSRAMRGPAVSLMPEAPGDRAAKALGGQDLTVEWAAFNDRWRIESDEPRHAHAVLHPRMMERLMRPDTVGLGVLVEGADVAVHAAGPTELDRIEPMAALVVDLAGLLPAFVVEDNPPLGKDATRRTARRRPVGGRRG